MSDDGLRFCAICGSLIYDEFPSISWANQFRGLYSCPEGIVLTGVGVHPYPARRSFIAPPDPSARWDDPGYVHCDEDEFAVMRQFEINGRRGFIFHDACWSLLEQAFHPTPVPLVRLFEVCDSFPLFLEGDCIKWGHDYGGFFILRDKNFFPWEDRFADEYPAGWFEHSPYLADPLARSEVDSILAETAPQEPPGNLSSSTVPVSSSSGNDPFSLLPMELCSAIAEYLPTADALNARQASRSFWHVFHSQQFWASRFRESSDRSWLFEVRHHKGAANRDWRWLYRCTIDSRIGPMLRNRKRIWGLIQDLAEILELHWRSLPSEPLPEKSRDWALAAGNMPPDQQPEGFNQLEYGCRCRKSTQIAIPDGISQVSASTVRVGNSEYIAGISMTTTSGQVLQLGYSNASRARSVRLSGLAGFNLAVGLGGIHALQCIDGRTGEPSAWLGCPDDAPKTGRLAVGTRVTALEVGFDGCRMAKIAVAQQTDDTTRADRYDRLRRSAIWYPDIPPPVLDLNEDFFTPLQSYTWGYRPLFWACFGGPGGIYIPHLTKVTASCGDQGLLRMDFSFDREVPAECRRFGRHEDSKYGKLVEFRVDGPNGEVIDKVEICQEYPHEGVHAAAWYCEEGALAWLRLSTNRGRTCEVGTRSNPLGKIIVTREISAAPGTAITGFFGAQYRKIASCISTLGVLTEPLRKN